ncbi:MULTISPECIES: sensor domain-containing phosphodiesterase [Shewanella]|uniref:EAL domain-containing protein n=1 Tax=Shewanella psychromarinicola TaxID=2487742 RepID=A0A3N4DZ14_9GAMM|nr:sensor domain-containing phosphodiesterase [Shewanella psychromarinicola]AZG35410.1 EAL domain-containing protein [Shewanella psychromarinicola]MCL1084220.1 EAL domain-containing protein [Shewanella psychromarinicola]RPA31145.1 EAL domain-containing protein [Shewanella psychromarinicola]
MTTKKEFLFAPETGTDKQCKENKVGFLPWKILSVEGDLSYQQALLHGLRGLVIQSRPVQILTVNSTEKAAEMLVKHEDIAVILLDAIMENDDSGIRLVDTIRNVQGNASVRIILLTEKPDSTSRKSVMEQYDIDEYWNKSEVQFELLITVLTAHIRTWESLRDLKQACLGLQMIVDAARGLNSLYDISSFTHTVLTEIGRVIDTTPQGIVCISKLKKSCSDDASLAVATVTAATEDSTNFIGLPFDKEIQEIFGKISSKALETQTHQFDEYHSALYFEGDNNLAEYFIILVQSKNPLSSYHINLLKVFGENISSGFTNISLINRLSQLAYQDPMLKIHNRNWLHREIKSMSKKNKGKSELLIFDVNHFTSRVLTFGEEHADELIKGLYNAIKEIFSDKYLISRIEIDTFAVICTKVDSPSESALKSLVSKPVVIHGVPHILELTIVRMNMNFLIDFPPEKVLYLGLSSLHIAREKSKSIIHYTPEYLEDIKSESMMMFDLRDAIKKGDLFVVIQPKINMTNMKVIGFEALLRWESENTNIPPSVFIPIAEKSGLITQLDSFVFTKSVEIANLFSDLGYDLPISFNTTCDDLKDPLYIGNIISTVENGLVDPSLLEIEITESQAMLDYDEINPILLQLRDIGIKISIDDFGTGYSSLAHITRLAATSIKIDRSFITNIETEESSYRVVDIIINLANRFGFSVIAEGIETKGQMETLLHHGCHIGQGYLFAKPMTLVTAIEWLKTQVT